MRNVGNANEIKNKDSYSDAQIFALQHYSSAIASWQKRYPFLNLKSMLLEDALNREERSKGHSG
jgi:hypothetical protein